LVDTTRYLEWFEMARKDLKGAEILFEHEVDNGLVFFHCQQAIEKYLKGFLISQTGLLHEGHNLIKLCKKAMDFNPNFKDFLKDCAFVNAFYVETRYPSEDPLNVTEEEVLMCLKIAKDIMEYIDDICKNK